MQSCSSEAFQLFRTNWAYILKNFAIGYLISGCFIVLALLCAPLIIMGFPNGPVSVATIVIACVTVPLFTLGYFFLAVPEIQVYRLAFTNQQPEEGYFQMLFSKTNWRYVLYTGIINILTLSIVLIGMLIWWVVFESMNFNLDIQTIKSESIFAGMSLLFISSILSLYVKSRLYFVFPSIALGHNLTFKDSYQKTVSSKWKLFLTIILLTLVALTYKRFLLIILGMFLAAFLHVYIGVFYKKAYKADK
jgi:hypothetical protein